MNSGFEILRGHGPLQSFQFFLTDASIHQGGRELPSVRDVFRIEPAFNCFFAFALFEGI